MSTILEQLTPTVPEFATWRGFETVDEFDAPLENVALHLRLATSLLILATDLTEQPDPISPLGLVVRAGLFDMAWYVGTSSDDREAMFSPFSSERIGSYSYSKSQKAVLSRESTGVPYFDLALFYLRKADDASTAYDFFVSSEKVFDRPFAPSRPAYMTPSYILNSPMDSASFETYVPDLISIIEGVESGAGA